jgi:hypothetical protein
VTGSPAAKLAKKPVPWRGRRRVADAKGKFIGVRVTLEDRAKIASDAGEAGYKIGGYLRALALGSAGPRALRRPLAEREVLAKILGETGKLGSNVNQIAKAFNSVGAVPTMQEITAMRADIAAMRAALMEALGHGD